MQGETGQMQDPFLGLESMQVYVSPLLSLGQCLLAELLGCGRLATAGLDDCRLRYLWAVSAMPSQARPGMPWTQEGADREEA